MSYILEALKKAQAERQLGDAPTIHAAPVPPAMPAPDRNRLLLLAGAAVLVLLALAVAWFVSRPAMPAAPAGAGNGMAATAATGAAAAPAPAVTPAAVTGAPAPAAPVALPPAPALAPAAPVVTPAPPARIAQATPVQAAPAPARSVNDLPEAVRRDLPRVSVGGYIYSPNAADRLLLVDKVLRHEGEEVAPGLVLEKLLPDGAVMNFRGHRYRVPY